MTTKVLKLHLHDAVVSIAKDSEFCEEILVLEIGVSILPNNKVETIILIKNY